MQINVPQEAAQQQLLQSPELLSSPASLPSSGPSMSSSPNRSRKSTLTLDLSNLPALEKPTPPSNTLIFTNLQSLDIFRPDNLETIRSLIANTAPIYSWSPLKSFRRIIVSFFSENDAIQVRSVWDGEAILGERCRVYFGQPVAINNQEDQHLALPDAGKLFFISPPPSPPHGWESRTEDAPNKMVHAEDLAEALARLRHNAEAVAMGGQSPVSPADSNVGGVPGTKPQRSRSSTLIFHPEVANGASPDLPCVTVDDMTDEPEDQMDISPIAMQPPKPIMAQTSRPPVELMHDA